MLLYLFKLGLGLAIVGELQATKKPKKLLKESPPKKKTTPKALQFQDAVFTLQGSVVVSLLMFEQASSGAAASVLADCTKGHSTIVIYDQ